MSVFTTSTFPLSAYGTGIQRRQPCHNLLARPHTSSDAPASISTFTTSKFPLNMADVSGVLPYSVGPNLSDAPASISACTTSTFPLIMADLSGAC